MKDRFVERIRSLKENGSQKPEEGRFMEIKNRRKDVVENLPTNQQEDKGLIRREVEKISASGDIELSEKRKKEILDRALNRYMLVHHIGEEGNNTCIDSVHASMANTGEIINILKTRDDWDELTDDGNVAMVINKEVEINKDILQSFEGGQYRIGTIVKELCNSDKYKNDKLAKAILRVKNLHEDYVGALANNVAVNIDSSGFVARFARRYLDANRLPAGRKIKKQNRVEFGKGYHLTQYCFLQEIFKEALEQEEEGEVQQPFLHVSLHGKSNKSGDVGDVIISNAVRDGKMPCDPQIARWFSDKLNNKMRDAEITKKKDGSYYTSGVSIEGCRFCGNVVHSDRRFGKKDFEGMKLGKNYQFIQVELSPFIRKNYFPKLQKILSEILKEFQEEFSNIDSFQDFLKQNETEEDRQRLEGKLYIEVVKFDDVPEGVIQLSSNFRDALGVNIGDSVLIDDERFIVGEITKDKINVRKPIVSSNSNVSGKVVVDKE